MNKYNVVFVDNIFNKYIKSTIKGVFPKLNEKDIKLLESNLIEILELIATTNNFNLENYIEYADFFKLNNGESIKLLLLSLLPNFNEEKNIKKKELLNIEQIFIGNSTNADYYSKIIYSLKQDSRLNYNEKFISDNFNLLKDTICRTSNKLYANWINIFPISIIDYPNADVYKNTKYKIINNIYNDNRSFGTDINQNNGLHISDIYNSIYYDLYENIKKVKWLIFNIKIGDRIYPLLTVLNSILPHGIDSFNFNDIDDLEYNINIPNLSKDIILYVFYIIFKYYNNYVKSNDEYDYDKEDKDDDLNEKKRKINIPKNIKGFKIYLKESINILKNTWYGYYLFDDDDNILKIHNDELSNNKFIYYNIIKVRGVNYQLTLKYVYNYAKSIIHISTPIADIISTEKRLSHNTFTKLGDGWNNINNENRSIFINRLKGIDIHWFNIQGVLSKVDIPHYHIKSMTWKIYEYIKNELADIIIINLIRKGVLTTIIPNPNLTKEDINEKYKDCYNYVNGEKYKNVMIDVINKGEYNSLDYMLFQVDSDKNDKWYTSITFSLSTQLSFFHHYLNNRVLFITGGTGSGKSTQVPKMFLYSSIMLSNRKNAKILCTQPRKSPVVSTSEYISKQLGISNKLNKYVQASYKGDNIESTSYANNYIKYITDGKILNSIINNKLLKVKRVDDKNNESMQNNKLYTYTKTNLYDVFLVDEVHEHNMNMDIIISLLKEIVTLNNDMRVVLVSATMENDENIYRSFFSTIDDNLLYPFNYNLITGPKGPISAFGVIHNSSRTDTGLQYDRQFVDRRYHIASYDQVGVYNIVEEINSEMTPIEKVKEIISGNIEGDILIFQPTKRLVNKLVDELNIILPSNIIALPFYRGLHDSNRGIIQNGIKTMNIDKKMVTEPNVIFFDENAGIYDTYDTIIIVATNIAESAITIDTLKYVIDTGTQNVVKYDITKDTVIALSNEHISEQSRKQRRGRVGRRMDGYVYYLYDITRTQNVIASYGITINNIESIVLNLLSNNGVKILDKNFSLSEKNNKYIGDIIDYYYYTDGKLITDLLNYTNNEEYIIKEIGDIYDNGFSLDKILDKSGKFYIIHPDENEITRDMFGNITNYENYDSVIEKYVNKLEFKKFIHNGQKSNIVYYIEKINDNVLLLEDIYKYSLVLLLSIYYNCFDDVISICCMILSMEKHSVSKNILDIINLCSKKSKSKFREHFYSELGDIHTFYLINNNIHKIFNNKLNVLFADISEYDNDIDIKNILNSNLHNNINNIYTWTKTKNLKSQFIIDYLHIYANAKASISDIYTDIVNDKSHEIIKNYITDMEMSALIPQSHDSYKNIINSFTVGFKSNILKKSKLTTLYEKLYPLGRLMQSNHVQNKNIKYNIPKISIYNQDIKALINSYNLSEYILYINNMGSGAPILTAVTSLNNDEDNDENNEIIDIQVINNLYIL